MDANQDLGLPPHVPLVRMAFAHWTSHIAFAAARLGIADHLADGPLDAATLAKKTATHAPSLGRFLRTLASMGVLTEDESHRFALTPIGRALRTGAPGAARATILTLAHPSWIAGFSEMLHSLEAGRSAYEKTFGMNIFEWLGKHPDEAALFSETMVGIHGMEPAAVAAAYDFSKCGTIVDVGGASGLLLTTVLGKAPRAKGILFDLPHVVRDVHAGLAASGMKDRVTVEGGSFFERVPKGGDVYLLSHVIHDWPESQCVDILRCCREAMTPGGRILLVEMVLPHGDTPHPGKMLDMMMLVGPGGQERTAEEYAALAKLAGLRMERIVPTESAVAIVELVAG